MSIDDGEGLRFAPSSVAGNLAFLIVTVLGLTAALDILGIEFLSDTFDDIVAFGGQLLRAAVLIMIGVFLANFISRIMAGMISPRIAEFFRYVAILIFVFLGLSSLDPAGDIIPIAFGALVIGTAVAGASGTLAAERAAHRRGRFEIHERLTDGMLERRAEVRMVFDMIAPAYPGIGFAPSVLLDIAQLRASNLCDSLGIN